MGKKCAIVHYRIGKTDGVSLEIRKWKRILKEMGYAVKLIAGTRQIGADYVIPELEFDHPAIVKIKENAFFNFKDFQSDTDFNLHIDSVANKIEQKFDTIQKKEHFDYLFLHNIFTHGRHIAAAQSFYNIAYKYPFQTIAVDHDFYWVGSYKDTYKPQTKFVKEYLHKYVPPSVKFIKHVTINSINQKALFDRIGIKSLIIPDTFDFNQQQWKKNAYNKDFLQRFELKDNDLIILQATRITVRKGIELAVDFVHELNKRKSKLVGRTLYNGKKINNDSKIVLLFAGYAEKDSLDYKEKLKDKIRRSGITVKFISSHIDAERRKEGDKKIYSLWDSYVFADLVTFPSWWEGWGNQFIEAVFAKKPILIFEYPVFEKDIKKEGYDVISLGNALSGKSPDGLVKVKSHKTTKAADKALRLLTDSRTNRVLQNNFNIGKKHHSFEALEKKLKKIGF